MPDHVARTRWGGLSDGRFRPSGYFRVEQDAGVFWLVDPEDGRFISKGINTVRFDQDRIHDSERFPYAEACQRKYGSVAAWRMAAAARLAGWGFNTLGAWSDEAVAHAGPTPLAIDPTLDLGTTFAWQESEPPPKGRRQHFPDVFDPEFERHITQRARALCGPHSGDPSILGWFIDNELRWAPDWRGPDELLTLFLNLPPASPGRATALTWLQQRYQSFVAFNAIWRSAANSWQEFAGTAIITPPHERKPPYQRDTDSEATANRAMPGRAAFAVDCDEFAALLAERYMALTAAAVRVADANHLILGCRFAYPPAPAVIAAAARHADVISFNCYDPMPDSALDAYAAVNKPCLIGEFSFRAADSGLPNTRGAGPVVADQAQRAASFGSYVNAALRRPFIVGYHWFEHADQPAEGRFDGENSNYGTVTIEDRAYDDLTGAMTALNAAAEDIHAATIAVA